MPQAQSILRVATVTGFVCAAIVLVPSYSRFKACRSLQAAHDRFEALASSPPVGDVSGMLPYRTGQVRIQSGGIEWVRFGVRKRPDGKFTSVIDDIMTSDGHLEIRVRAPSLRDYAPVLLFPLLALFLPITVGRTWAILASP